MATTVAAAAALLGGVTDTSSLMQPSEGADYDAMFGTDPLVADSALIDNSRCHFDNTQLAVSTLDLPDAASSFHGNICH